MRAASDAVARPCGELERFDISLRRRAREVRLAAVSARVDDCWRFSSRASARMVSSVGKGSRPSGRGVLQIALREGALIFIVVELTGLALDVNMHQNVTKNHINTHYVNKDSQRGLCRNILRMSFKKRSRKSYMQ